MARLGLSPRHAALIFLTALIAGALATLAITLAASAVFGHKVIAISSSTMEPTLSDGDLLIAPEVPPDDIAEGELVTFAEPGTDRTLTRRVTKVAPAEGRVFFEVKPDAGSGVQRFSVAEDGQVAKPLRRIPLAGHLGDALTGATALILVPLIALLVLGSAEIRTRIRSAPES